MEAKNKSAQLTKTVKIFCENFRGIFVYVLDLIIEISSVFDSLSMFICKMELLFPSYTW